MSEEINLKNGYKIYKKTSETIKALNNVDLKIEKGKFYAIMGHSGSGKSTLIQILGLLDSLTSGKLYIDGKETSNMKENDKTYIRMKKIGFVFQSFYLNPKLKAIENVMLPMYINKEIKGRERKQRAKDLLKSFNLSDRINHYPKELSGGEQQRVAIARALANNPEYILADEPTGNLDIDNEKIVLDLLKKLTREGKTVVVVSHNEIVKDYADEIYYMSNGEIRSKI
ncbi:MAG: ABC transporter ATP-binding protein [Clostridia bacterium]|nr:ABC transporter ATP-binding protein [Clostridia bacterium]